jgi:threonine dehydrogenase-like Zn-dependent dehydrogenase
MKAVVFHAVGDIRMDDVPEPRLEQPTDAIVRLTGSAICGTDLHFVRGTMADMVPGTVLGHEGIGIVESVGSAVSQIKVGERVVIPSTIACGGCEPCAQGDFAQCNRANPNGPEAGTAFYGGPKSTGPFQGLQAERARVPFADTNLVTLPAEVSDEQAILLSDIFPTGYFGAILAGVGPGKTVAVFGCGPVGMFSIASAKILGAARVIAIDTIPSRLALAKAQGAEVIDYNQQDPVQAIKQLTSGRGVDCVIDAVGVDANHPERSFVDRVSPSKRLENKQFKKEVQAVAPKTKPDGDNWHPGDAPSQALRWAVKSLKKVGTLGVVGVYPLTHMSFPLGEAMNKNLTLRMGNCNHRQYIPELISLVTKGVIDPAKVVTQHEHMESAIDAYKAFDRREAGWVKVMLEPQAGAAE